MKIFFSVIFMLFSFAYLKSMQPVEPLHKSPVTSYIQSMEDRTQQAILDEITTAISRRNVGKFQAALQSWRDKRTEDLNIRRNEMVPLSETQIVRYFADLLLETYALKYAICQDLELTMATKQSSNIYPNEKKWWHSVFESIQACAILFGFMHGAIPDEEFEETFFHDDYTKLKSSLSSMKDIVLNFDFFEHFDPVLLKDAEEFAQKEDDRKKRLEDAKRRFFRSAAHWYNNDQKCKELDYLTEDKKLSIGDQLRKQLVEKQNQEKEKKCTNQEFQSDDLNDNNVDLLSSSVSSSSGSSSSSSGSVPPDKKKGKHSSSKAKHKTTTSQQE